MTVRAISSSIAWALVGFSFLSCAWSGGVTSSHGTSGVAPRNECFDLGSNCLTSHDCCSQLCQNGYCVEQPGGT
jgi:hypothetical protein